MNDFDDFAVLPADAPGTVSLRVRKARKAPKSLASECPSTASRETTDPVLGWSESAIAQPPVESSESPPMIAPYPLEIRKYKPSRMKEIPVSTDDDDQAHSTLPLDLGEVPLATDPPQLDLTYRLPAPAVCGPEHLPVALCKLKNWRVAPTDELLVVRKDLLAYSAAVAELNQASDSQLYFVLGKGAGDVVVVRLRGCLDSETGRVADWAVSSLKMVEHTKIYAEVDPEGTGVTLLLRGTIRGKRVKGFRFPKRHTPTCFKISDDEEFEFVDRCAVPLTGRVIWSGRNLPAKDNQNSQLILDMLLDNGMRRYQPNTTEILDQSWPFDLGRHDRVEVAREYLLKLSAPLRRWRGSWYVYDEQRHCYRQLSEEELRSKVNQDMDDFAEGVNKKTLDNLIDELRSRASLSSDLEQPCWLDDTESPAADELLACRNGLIELPSEAAGDVGKIIDHTPGYFSSFSLDYGFDPAAACPNWLNFMGQLWGDDLESIQLLQTWFGYCLQPGCEQQKMLWMVGPPRAGKGVITTVLTAMLAATNVANPRLSSLGSNFGLANLLHKRLAIIADARLSGRTDNATIVETLLGIVGQDAQNIERKYRDTLTNVRLDLKIMLSANTMPALSDASGALHARLLLLEFRKSFVGREDLGLKDKLLGELPGILNWAIAGYRMLKEQGRFIQPTTSQQRLESFIEWRSPIPVFVAEECVLDPEATITKAALFDAWNRWADSAKIEHRGSAGKFSEELQAAFSQLREFRVGSQPRCWRGIEIKSGWQLERRAPLAESSNSES